MEDLDKNKDGYVQVEEYIGEWVPPWGQWWRTYSAMRAMAL
jgi:hypothetical protein